MRGGTPSLPTTVNQTYRPYSSGQPAPAIAVPIFRSQVGAQLGARALDLPESPPDTPPHSPPRSRAPIRIVEDDNASIATASTTTRTAALDVLTQATNNLLLQPNYAYAHSVPSQPSMSAPASTRASTSAIELMPATPEISPDNDVRHHGHKSARAFLHRIFGNVTDEVAIEDAGVELVSPGWTGAVIKTGSDHCITSTSLASNTSSSASSSSDSQRTLYVSMPKAVDSSLLREQVLSILDAASDKLGCENVMICLQSHMRDFSSVLHGLCYVGGQIVAASSNTQSPSPRPTLGDERTTVSNTDPVSGLELRDHLVLVAVELQ